MPLTEPQYWLLRVLLRGNVRFLIVGGHALPAHGVHRPTKDLDIWVSNSEENAARMAQGFRRIRAPLPKGGDWEAAFQKEHALYAYPDPGPGKEADILTSIPGMDFDACFKRSVPLELQGLNVRAVGLDDLIEIKTISAHSGNDEAAKARDLADIDALLSAL
jgi:nucleotidyltransferase AbiEii toxin of type IV toxin-antitoxin system